MCWGVAAAAAAAAMAKASMTTVFDSPAAAVRHLLPASSDGKTERVSLIWSVVVVNMPASGSSPMTAEHARRSGKMTEGWWLETALVRVMDVPWTLMGLEGGSSRGCGGGGATGCSGDWSWSCALDGVRDGREGVTVC